MTSMDVVSADDDDDDEPTLTLVEFERRCGDRPPHITLITAAAAALPAETSSTAVDLAATAAAAAAAVSGRQSAYVAAMCECLPGADGMRLNPTARWSSRQAVEALSTSLSAASGTSSRDNSITWCGITADLLGSISQFLPLDDFARAQRLSHVWRREFLSMRGCREQHLLLPAPSMFHWWRVEHLVRSPWRRHITALHLSECAREQAYFLKAADRAAIATALPHLRQLSCVVDPRTFAIAEDGESDEPAGASTAHEMWLPAKLDRLTLHMWEDHAESAVQEHRCRSLCYTERNMWLTDRLWLHLRCVLTTLTRATSLAHLSLVFGPTRPFSDCSWALKCPPSSALAPLALLPASVTHLSLHGRFRFDPPPVTSGMVRVPPSDDEDLTSSEEEEFEEFEEFEEEPHEKTLSDPTTILRKLVHLEVVNINGGDGDVEKSLLCLLAAPQPFLRLREFDLGCSFVTDSVVLEPLLSVATLERFEPRSLHVQDVSFLTRWPHLKYLGLSSKPYSEDDAIPDRAILVRALAQCMHLERLQLAHPSVTSEDLELIFAQARSPLDFLELRCPALDSLAFLTRVPHLARSLTDFYMYDCIGLPACEAAHLHSLRALRCSVLFYSFDQPLEATLLEQLDPDSKQWDRRTWPDLQTFVYAPPISQGS